MTTIACVLRSGGDYGPEWVEKLACSAGNVMGYRLGLRFVCLTDMEVPHVECIPLAYGWPGWFSKLELFRPGLFAGETHVVTGGGSGIGRCTAH